MKVFKKVIAVFMIMIIINVFTILANVSEVKATDTVSLSLVTQPDIDVVLSKSHTKTDLTNFKSDLLNALKEQGVDINKVNISAVETVYNQVSSNDINVDAIINSWDTIGAPTWSAKNGQIYSNSPSSSADWSDNPSIKWDYTKDLSWWGTGLIDPNGYETEEITMDFTMVTGGQLNEGVCFNVTMNDDGSLNGYFVTICNHSDSQCRLWRFDHYTLDQSFASGINRNMWCHPFEHTYKRDNDSWNVGHTSTYENDSFTCLAGWTTESSNVPYHIEYKNNNIIIKVNNEIVANVTDTTYTKGTYGFWGNNCESGGLMYITNIKISTVQTNVKKLEEVLREPDWREDSIKVLVNVEDTINEQLNNPQSLGELLTRMINDEIYYVPWGNSTNQSQSENFIASNNDNGKFINNTNYSNSIIQTAEYIKSLIQTKQSSNYVILNENTILSATDSSIMTNTAGGDYPYGRWKILHDCEYFENNIGQFAQSGKYISDMITSFNKTGKYEILYEDNNVEPTYIYVHRKPVAEIDVKRSGNTVTLTSLGYDLDKYSTNRGIKQEEWKYRKVGETTWTDGKLTNISSANDWLVQLRVQDYQGTWSAPVTKYITKSDVLPIASFKIKNRNTSIYEEIEIVDGSYDPYGGTITSRKWTVYKGDTQIYTGSTPLANYKSSGIGNYTMALEVTNNRGKTSEVFKRNFTIIPDDEAPEFTATPMNCDWTTSQTVNFSFTDRLGSGFKNYQYAITTSQETPSSWSSEITNQTDSITINQEGIQYLHIIATDNAGNTSEDRVLGPYKIDRTAPTFTATPENCDWTTSQTVTLEFTDPYSGFKNYQYAVTNSEAAPSEYSEAIAKSIDTITIEQDGIWYIHVKTTDNIGNTSEDIVVGPYKIDRTPPTGTMTNTPTTWTRGNVTIQWEFSDAQSGINYIKLPNGKTTTDSSGNYVIGGNGTYTFVAYDNVGNYQTFTQKVNNIDKTAPKGTISHEPIDWVIDDVTIYWSFKDTQSGMQNVILPDGTSTTDIEGTYVVSENDDYIFKAYDKVGNTTIMTETIDNIDKIAPEGILYLTNNNLTDGPIEIVWEAFDSQSGLDRVILPDSTTSTSDNGRFKVSKLGVYTFILYDKAGNDRKISIDASNVDMEKPYLTVKQEITRWTNEDVPLYWEAGDNQSGLKEVVLPDSSRKNEAKGEYIATQNGIYTFLAYDNIGNGILVEHEVTNIDKTSPFLKLKTELDDNGNVKVIWEMSDSQSGVRNIVLPNGEVSSAQTGEYTALENGTYTFIAYDNVGNDTVMSVEVNNIDNEGIVFNLWQENTDDGHYRIGWNVLDGQEDFKYILLPNNTYSEERQGYFEVENEGTYTFLAYDRAGNETKGVITINPKRVENLE